ncbi:hypothetical protein HPP92_017223 [Vanilla planifolia]|uniref:Uncharacterized protein n=1 Tax=Vanilla planifolia TaxID=51239 RepID=A0A835QBZ1_VANPL|nr:hypothetical protein HPP92_017223 [Vanilla planifolia]
MASESQSEPLIGYTSNHAASDRLHLSLHRFRLNLWASATPSPNVISLPFLRLQMFTSAAYFPSSWRVSFATRLQKLPHGEVDRGIAMCFVLQTSNQVILDKRIHYFVGDIPRDECDELLEKVKVALLENLFCAF